MDWYIKKFHDLTTLELYQILHERVNVFVVEQECPYPEIDNKDQDSYHLFAKENDEIITYARLLPLGISYEKQASIGRVLVRHDYRNTGLGKKLMERGLEFLKEQLHEKEIKLQAQEYAQKFYASFGFRPISEVYPEDDIPHIDMLWQEEVKREA
ncbi:GNAT family N-acetyltransferase [Salipaludibacillus neizhouensis]|uniref:GNAT family N-acetyltransferase n=1 Tax=Salipaludibacillus neizhouensis TaxID=885475 RepID=A0A3A9K4F2_9BACI|nr:GNAT family N-acetyltransferase [Salipaludibacillus neizhouensis]RKL66208.1 GNAT family N-acetyltransferase [Salipaludibacillus neizhouensis]